MANKADQSLLQRINDRLEQPWMNDFTEDVFGFFTGSDNAKKILSGRGDARTGLDALSTFGQRVGSTVAGGGLVPLGAAYSKIRPAGRGEMAQTATQVGEAIGTPGELQAAGAGLGGALDAFEDAQRTINTGLSTGILTVGAVQAQILNALPGGTKEYDVFAGEIDDVRDTWDKVWAGEVTPGRAISHTFGRSATNAADFVTGGRGQTAINNWIEEKSKEAINNPENARGLLHWTSGLHSEFDILDKFEADSAYNQGVGRWISGAADAAILWWAAPDIIVAKGAGLAGRKLLTKSMDSLGDKDKAAVELAQHRAALRGEKTVDVEGTTYKAKRTALGRLSDSLVKLNARQAIEHDLAKQSSNKALVAQVIAEADTPEKMDLGLKAMLGDAQAMRQAKDEFSASVADGVNLVAERNARVAEYLRLGNEGASGSADRAAAIGQQAEEIERLDKVLKETMEESAELADAMAAGAKGTFSTTGQSAVRFGTQSKKQTIRLSRFEGGVNSPRRMATDAMKRADRKAGKLFTEKNFKSVGGRVIRVFKPMADYITTYRAQGKVNIWDSSDDLYDEIVSIFSTNGVFRRLQKLAPAARNLTEFNEKGIATTNTIDIDAMRAYWLERAIQARSSTERQEVIYAFQNEMIKVLRSEYGISARKAKRIFAKYKEKRKDIDEQIDTYGWFKDGDEIIAVPDLQSQMGQTVDVMDFDFIENIFRLEMGAPASQTMQKLKKVPTGKQGGENNALQRLRLSYQSGVIANLDAIWRPLVLMRLGYTQRNVVEGALRELAAYGTLGALIDRDKAIMLDPNMSFAERTGYRFNQFTSAFWPSVMPGSYKKKVKKLTRDITKKQAELQDVVGEVEAQRRLQEKAQERLDFLAGKTRARAERNLVERKRADSKRHAGATFERVTEATEQEVAELMDNATDIYVPAQFVKPLYQAGGKKNSKSVSGYEDEADVVPGVSLEQSGGDVQNLDDIMGFDENLPYASLAPYMANDAERELLRKVIYAQPGEEGYDDLVRLTADASLRAAAGAQRRGFAVVRIMGNGRYEVIQNLDEITVNDVMDATIAVVPKENFGQIQYVKAKVYGDVLDLRMLDDAQSLDDYLASDEFAEYMSEEMIWVDEVEEILDVLEADPDLAQAIILQKKLDALFDEYPEIHQAAREAGLLAATGKARKRAKDRFRKTSDKYWQAKQDADAAVREIVLKLDDPEFVQTVPEMDGIAPVGDSEWNFHGGNLPEGNILADPEPNTKQNVESWAGGGFHATGDSTMGMEYAVTKNAEDGKLYLVHHPYSDNNFIDVDARFIDPETGIKDEQVEDLTIEWLDNTLAEAELDVPLDEAYDEIIFAIQRNRDAEQFSNALSRADDIDPSIDVRDFLLKMQEYLLEAQAAGSAHEAQGFIHQAARNMGAVGIRHIGGGKTPSAVYGVDRRHPVYIYYVPVDIYPVESLTPEIVRVSKLTRRANELEEKFAVQQDVEQFYTDIAPYNVANWDAADMTPRVMDTFSRIANEAGYGSVIVSDTLAPSGRRIITRPDYMTFDEPDNIDDVIPGGMLEDDYITRVFPELEQKNLLADSSVYSGRDRDELMAWIGNEEAVNYILNGGQKRELSTEARVAIVQALEGGPDGINKYSHISIGPENKVLSQSELMGGKKFGAAYGAILNKSDVDQEYARLAKNDSSFQRVQQEVQERTKEIDGMQAQIDEQVADLKQASEKLKRITFKRTRRKTPNRGFGKEKFDAAYLPEGGIEIEGPFADELYATMASSDNRNRLMLYGLADISYREMQRSQDVVMHQPGDEYYYTKVAEQLNNLFRRDPVALMLLRNPELKNNDVFAEALPSIIDELTKSQRGRAWLRDQGGVEEFKGLVDAEILRNDAFDRAYEAADAIRVQLDELLPNDDDLWRKIGGVQSTDQYTAKSLEDRLADLTDETGGITSVELMAEAGYRTDWGGVKDYDMILRDERWYRKVLSKAMNTLGTVPEDHTIRHPFFRARWREDMRRQMDLYAGQKLREDPNWDGFFTNDEISQMNLVARQYALKSVRETLYTLQRISTPAHVMKFISPFFPAWASTMRFWTVRMPLQKPENVIRYSYIFDAPARAGMMEDREGNQLEGQANPIDRFASKFQSDDDNMIVIQTTGATRKWLEENVGMSRAGVSRGSLDMMLQGDTFWLPGFGPLITLGIGALAAWNPADAERFKAGFNYNGPMSSAFKALTKAIYDSTLPFGPSKEKSPADIAFEQFAPGMLANAGKLIRGTDSASFSNTAQTIYRDAIYDWDASGRVGPKPEFRDAVDQSQVFYLWRIAISGTAPFAPSFSSGNQFYVNEWRAIERDTYDSGGDYTDAMDKFIGKYGREFFAYTQSLSAGSSGVSAKSGEYLEVTGNMELYGNLANIGDDASYMTMASRGVADWSYDEAGFDPAIYAWQFNRSIENAPGKFFRAGSNQRSDMLQDVERQAGWYYYNKALEPYKTLYENDEIDEATYKVIKDQVVYQLATEYPSWYEQYGKSGNERYIQSAKALDMILSNEKWMKQHGETDYARAMYTFQEWRNSLIQILVAREAAGGSASIDAKSNADIAIVYENMVKEVGAMDPSGNAARAIDRFFGENDPLVAIPGVDY